MDMGEGKKDEVPWDGQQPQILANALASDSFTFRAMVSSMTSQRTYMQDITPMKRTYGS